MQEQLDAMKNKQKQVTTSSEHVQREQKRKTNNTPIGTRT